MPTRIIRDGILTSERINALSPLAELFYRRLMSVADDHGRYSGNLTQLRAYCYPLKLDSVKEDSIKKHLAECVDAGLIVPYTIEGKPYILLCDFGQRINGKSKFPEPPVNPPGFPGIPRLVVDVGEVVDDEEQGALPAAPPPADPKPKANKGSRLPADWTLPDDWAAWAKQERPDLHPPAVAARFADHWHAKPGKDGVKLDWLATWRNWVRGEKTATVGGWQRPAEPRRIDTPEETRKRLAEAAPRKVSDPHTASAAMAASMAMLRGGRDG